MRRMLRNSLTAALPESIGLNRAPAHVFVAELAYLFATRICLPDFVLSIRNRWRVSSTRENFEIDASFGRNEGRLRNRCEFRARFGQNQRVRCEMMLEALIYFRIWAVTVRFARFRLLETRNYFRNSADAENDAYKKPAELDPVPPACSSRLAGCSSSRARRLFQGQRQRSEARRVPRRLRRRVAASGAAFCSKGIEAERWKLGTSNR